MTTFITVIQVLLGFGAGLLILRAWKGPDLVDRIVALDLVLLMLAGGLAAEAARTGSQFYIAAVIVVALIAFAGTILVARFVEWRDVP
ncbi:MAG: monovalent cation/H+ antiporter complex subunit F [Acidimicrobiia bacterium]|nr:monovalent cation/H+ antiporter complex subunit F [Acidimicrobiia bacterium]